MKKLAVFVIILSCSSVPKVAFKTPVDTRDKKIVIEKKRVYRLPELGVSASNDFLGARLSDFKKLNDSTAVLHIHPENTPINMSSYYAFKIWSDTVKPFYLTFRYPKSYKHRYFPKLKRKNGIWHLMNKKNIFHQSNGNTLYKFNLDKDTLTVAAQPLQTSKNVYQWCRKIIKNKPYVHLKTYGRSKLGRELPVLDIYKKDPKNKPIVCLLTRQHPPEVTGHFAFQFFLKTILDDSILSKKFLQKYHVIAFPIMNPDGVDLGHWRHNAGGVDLNRDWSKYRQPEIKQCVEFITRQIKKNKSKVILGLDFHSTWEDIFYTNKDSKTTRPNFVKEWFASLENNIPNYKVNKSPGINSTKPVSKGWFLYAHNATGITYEIGDNTPLERIKQIGTISAKQMMKILLKDVE